MLRREQKIRNIVLFSLFSILFIGVGYAVISSSLNINGSLQLSKITWDVRFENFTELDDNTVKATTHTISENGTTLTYNVKLNKPGDRYSFTVDVVNAGTIGAMVQSLGNSGLTDAQKQVLDYSVTYIDGNNPKQKDALPIGESETFFVSISAKADITNSQLSSTDTSLTLKLNPTYAQDDGTSVSRSNKIYNVVKNGAVLDSIKSEFVATTGIDFSQVSSNTNGKGVYILSSTKDDKHPIYYFRGAVENNNVIFADYCWKMVRTTETGGIKIVYNGIPSEDGKCNNTGKFSQLTGIGFNLSRFSPADVGYMYGDVYNYKTGTANTYASSATYDESSKKYTLVNVQSSLNATHHYSCGNDINECSTLRYYFHLRDDVYYYVELNNGKLIEDAFDDMLKNKTNSNIKNYIENEWYDQKMTKYTKQIEDTVYCNDRTIFQKNGWDSVGGSEGGILYFGSYDRRNKGNPSLACEREIDQFTVSKSLGNGMLKYPVGLLTVDELMLAGAALNTANNSFYLYTGENYWLLSPCSYGNNYADGMNVSTYGNLVSSRRMTEEDGLRPAISLKSSNTIKSGTGTLDDPYIVN